MDWYLHVLGLDFELRAPSDASNPHPFGQSPALRDDANGVELWESGAILQYLADAYGGLDAPATRADDIIPAHELDAAMIEIVGPAKWVNAVQEDLLKRVGLEGVAPTYAASLKGKEKGEGGGGEAEPREDAGAGGAAGGGAAPMET